MISFSVCVPLIMIAQLIEPRTVEVWVENLRSLVRIWLEGIPFYYYFFLNHWLYGLNTAQFSLSLVVSCTVNLPGL